MKFLLLAVALAITACDHTGDQREQISATQAVVDQKVNAGRMTPAEGRAAMADLKANIAAERRRNYATMTSGGYGVAVYQPIGGGAVIRY